MALPPARVLKKELTPSFSASDGDSDGSGPTCGQRLGLKQEDDPHVHIMKRRYSEGQGGRAPGLWQGEDSRQLRAGRAGGGGGGSTLGTRPQFSSLCLQLPQLKQSLAGPPGTCRRITENPPCPRLGTECQPGFGQCCCRAGPPVVAQGGVSAVLCGEGAEAGWSCWV